MWEISVTGQVSAFLWAILLGSSLCLFYDGFRLFYALSHCKAWLSFLLDVIYWAIAAFIVFSFFLIFFAGQIRGFVFLPILAGFLLYRSIFSRLLFGKVLALFRRLLIVLRKISAFLWRRIDQIAAFFQKILKIVLQPVKKGLKHLGHLLYNQSKRIVGAAPQDSSE